MREVIDVLPENPRFQSVDDMLREVAVREATALRTSDTGTTAITSAFGLGVDVRTVAEAPIERFVTIPAAARTALTNNGITTMQELTEASPDAVAEILASERIAADRGDAAEWVAGAMALTFTR